MSKKALFDELLARKLQREADKEKILEIDMPGEIGDDGERKTLIFRKSRREKLLDYMDRISQDDSMINVYNVYKEFIFDTCPAISDKKLIEACGAVDPYDVVDMLFSVTEVLEIGDKLSKFNDLSEVTAEIKN